MSPERRSVVTSAAPSEGDTTPAGLFRLPIEIRTIIYSLVLTVNWPLFLFLDGDRVRRFTPVIPRRWLALLHTSRQVYEEAAAVAYGSIRFTLVDRSEQTRLLECFLDTIGPANSSVVSYLSMDFPHVDISTDGVGESRVGAESVRGIELPRDRCTGLRTLETKMHGLAANGWTKVDEQNLGPVCDGLSQVNVRLREIPSLNKVIVRIYGGTLRPSVIEAMKRLKWIVFIGDRMEPVQ